MNEITLFEAPAVETLAAVYRAGGELQLCNLGGGLYVARCIMPRGVVAARQVEQVKFEALRDMLHGENYGPTRREIINDFFGFQGWHLEPDDFYASRITFPGGMCSNRRGS